MKLEEFNKRSVADLERVRDLLLSWLNEKVIAFGGLMVSEVLEQIEDVLGRFSERREASDFSDWMRIHQQRHQSAGVNFSFNEHGAIPENRCYEYELIYIFQELCGNAIKHGGASHIQILVVYIQGGMNVTVSDNGKGFAVSSCEESGVGIHLLRSKLERIGGTLKFAEHPDGGCIAMIKQRESLVKNGLDFTKNDYIASELHDVLCPALISFSMMLFLLEKQLDENTAEKWCQLEEAKSMISKMAGEARDVSHSYVGELPSEK